MSFIFSVTVSLFAFWAQQLPMKIHYILYFLEISNLFWFKRFKSEDCEKAFQLPFGGYFFGFSSCFSITRIHARCSLFFLVSVMSLKKLKIQVPRLICPRSPSPVPQHLVDGWLVYFDPVDRPIYFLTKQAWQVFLCLCMCVWGGAFFCPLSQPAAVQVRRNLTTHLWGEIYLAYSAGNTRGQT